MRWGRIHLEGLTVETISFSTLSHTPRVPLTGTLFPLSISSNPYPTLLSELKGQWREMGRSVIHLVGLTVETISFSPLSPRVPLTGSLFPLSISSNPYLTLLVWIKGTVAWDGKKCNPSCRLDSWNYIFLSTLSPRVPLTTLTFHSPSHQNLTSLSCRN